MSYLSVEEKIKFWRKMRPAILLKKIEENRGITNFELFQLLWQDDHFVDIPYEKWYSRYSQFHFGFLMEARGGLKILKSRVRHLNRQNDPLSRPTEWAFAMDDWSLTPYGREVAKFNDAETEEFFNKREIEIDKLRVISKRHQCVRAITQTDTTTK